MKQQRVYGIPITRLKRSDLQRMPRVVLSEMSTAFIDQEWWEAAQLLDSYMLVAVLDAILQPVNDTDLEGP